jgi:twitching motility protein PilJ
MKSQVSEAKYMPILGAVLALFLAGVLVLVTLGRDNRVLSGPTELAALTNAQFTLLLADRALAGDSEAFESLTESFEVLRSLSTAGLPADQAEAIAGLTNALAVTINGREVLTTVSAVAADLDTLVDELTDRVYDLQGAMTLQQQPIINAQMERLRLLGLGASRTIHSLSTGLDDPTVLTQQLIDGEMAMSQIVRGFRDGDPELGLRALSEAREIESLSLVSETNVAISDHVKDVLSLSDQLAVIDQARQQLSGLALRLGGPSFAAEVNPAGPPVGRLLSAGLLLGCFALLAAMTWIYYRSAGLRRAAAAQAEQTDRNQQAIMRLLDELSSLADGDLTITATVTEDITGAIADSINYAIEALRELVATLNDSAITVDGAAKQTDETAQQLATASDALSKQVDSASQAIAAMAASIEEVSGNAERSSDVARHSVDVAHKGGEAVRRTIEGMKTIRETIQDTSKRIKRLGESSQEIGNIVELINDIADQTNILALNASIQASMAGEAGRGFAVVADEVQRLAERSANATKQIEVLVRTIQTDTNEAVVSMERSTTDVVGGALLAENAGAALEEIEQVSNQIASLVQNISSSAQEQGTAAKAVTRNMDILQEINSQTASGTRKTTKSIRELAELAAQLRAAVSDFRLPESQTESDSDYEKSDEWPGEYHDRVSDSSEESDDGHFVDQKTA